MEWPRTHSTWMVSPCDVVECSACWTKWLQYAVMSGCCSVEVMNVRKASYIWRGRGDRTLWRWSDHGSAGGVRSLAMSQCYEWMVEVNAPSDSSRVDVYASFNLRSSLMLIECVIMIDDAIPLGWVGLMIIEWMFNERTIDSEWMNVQWMMLKDVDDRWSLNEWWCWCSLNEWW